MVEAQPTWLSAEDPGGPSKLYYQFQALCTRALVAKKADSGALVCVPRAGVPLRFFEEAAEHSYPGDLGPYVETAIPAVVSGRQQERLLEVIIFDLDAGGLMNLSTSRPAEFAEEECTPFGKFKRSLEWPATAPLLECVTNFIAQGGDRLDGYFSALEVPDVPTGGSPVADGIPVEEEAATGVEAMLKQLLTQSEVTQRVVTGMQDRVASLDRLEARLQVLEKKGPLGATPKAAAAPQLFDTTPAGLTPQKQARLSQLASRGPGRLKDLGPTGQAGQFDATHLGGITVEPEEEEEEEGLAPEPGQGSALELLLASQTKILEKLVNAKASAQDPLNLLSSGVENEDVPRSSGIKGIAARQVLIDGFRKHPSKVVNLFRERLTLARRKGSLAELEPRDLWYHFQESVPLGSHKTLTYLAFLSAAMFEAQERGDLERLQMLVVLQSVFIEQAAHDGGSLRLAHLLTGLEDPPFSQTELHRTARAELPHGQLSDPRWVATQLAYLRDVETITDKSTKFRATAKPPDPADDLAPKRNPKWRPKKPKKNSEMAEEEA